MAEGIVLVVRRTIRASAERIFEAWTRPEHLRAWWGPRPVTCSGAGVDLRVGGKYWIANALPDGSTVTIEGEFREVAPPHRLVYTWRMAQGEESSVVTVRFEARGPVTEVIVVHENVPSAAARESHETGWDGCLDGLALFLATLTTRDETRRVVENYFAAWTTKDVDAAYALLASDLEFSGPTASYRSAEAFRPALVGFATMTRGARIVELIVQGERAALLYDCDLPEPAGTLRIASFFHVENGRIRAYDTRFDATELRKLLPRNPA